MFFQSWRLKIREAEAALRGGRLEEAAWRMHQGQLREFLPGRKLAARIASRMGQRARERARRGESSAGWRDLKTAVELEGESEKLDVVRNELVTRGLAEAERMILAGNIAEARDRLNRLARRYRSTSAIRLLHKVADLVEAAQRDARCGRFRQAADRLVHAAALRPDLSGLIDQREAYRQAAEVYRQVVTRLHGALADENWGSVLQSANELLELAPESREAASARRRAWRAVDIVTSRPASEMPVDNSSAGLVRIESPRVETDPPESSRIKQPPPPPKKTSMDKFLLWIDAVGGFLVCMGDEIRIGRADDQLQPEVAVLADLSRKHALIRRDGESYLLEPLHGAQVDGQPVQGIAALSDGAVIELGNSSNGGAVNGDSVELRFRQPHPLSATARLEPISRHRTEPHVDAVVLMADTCVLGPGWQSHVVCRDWPADVMLFRKGKDVYCRCKEPWTLDGREVTGSARLSPGSRVEGDAFAFSIEGVECV